LSTSTALTTELKPVEESTAKETLTEVAIQRLTADIVDGVLAPEQKLLIADLKKSYGMGASPLREAMARLSSLGFVVFDRRRGFRVAPISKEDLEDITLTRQTLETTALRRAIALGGDEWEVGIVTAYARLQRVVARCVEGGDGADDLEATHKQFHTALLAGCQSRRLLLLHGVFHDQASRYRQVMLEKTHSLDDFLKSHDRLASVALARNADEACAMLSEHMAITLQKVYPAQPLPPVRKARAAGAKKAARSATPAR
jgi:GntR family transcriptional regulator, carbon starvation induced regulator